MSSITARSGSSRYRALCSVVFALPLLACSDTGHKPGLATAVQAPVPRAEVASNNVAATSAPTLASVILGNRSMALVNQDGKCAVVVTERTAGAAKYQVPLDLHEPCALLIWQPDSFKGPKAASGGIRIGADGEVMAWRYPSAKNTTVAMVMGDAISDEAKVQRPNLGRMGVCASRTQALLLADGEKVVLRALPKSTSQRIVCSRFGLDEKDFWLAAHSQ